MKRLLVLVLTALSTVITPAIASQPKSEFKLVQSTTNQAYLNLLNRALAQRAPDYLNVPDQDKIRYGHYTCQALDAGLSLDTIVINYAQAIVTSTPKEQQDQAGMFLDISMGAGVQSFCPEHIPLIVKWLKARGFILNY